MGSAASGGRVPPRPKPETPRSRVREARTQWLTASVHCLRVRGGRPAGRAQDCNPESKTNPWMAFSRCVLGRWSLIRRPQKHSFPQLCRSRPMGSTRFYPMGAHRCVPSTPPAPGSPGVSPHPGTIAISQLQYHKYRSSSFPAMLVDPRVTFSFPVSVSRRRESSRVQTRNAPLFVSRDTQPRAGKVRASWASGTGGSRQECRLSEKQNQAAPGHPGPAEFQMKKV